MNRIIDSCLLVLVAFSFVCCTQEELEDRQVSKNAVSFVIGNGEIATKAQSASTHSEMNEISYELGQVDGEKLSLIESISTIDSQYGGVSPVTKGVPVYTSNLSDIYPSMAVTAYNAVSFDQWGTTDHSFDYVKDSNNKYLHDYESEGLEWPEPRSSTPLRYFIRAPYSASSDPCSSISRDARNSSISFHYESPSKAVDQKDILFSTTDISYDSKESDSNHVILFHALSGVKFKITDDCLSEGFVITKVEFANVVNKGNCSVTTKTYDASTNSSDVVSWNLGSTPSRAAFSHEFPSGVVSVEKGDGSKFADSFYGTTSKNNLNASDFSQTFWFIPQSLDGITVTIYFKKNGGTEQSSKVTFGAGKAWNAGELHTYALAVKGAGVSIEDTVDGLTKKNLKITNTGNMPEYFRVAVIANWIDSEGNVIAPQTVNLGTLGANWTLNAKDGYYYYTNPVDPDMQPGQTKEDDEADLLFSSYTAPAKPEGADHLQMDLAVQAIDTKAKTYKEVWAEAASVTF